MDNLTIYNRVREAPKEALRPIQAGRLKGKTDINPMWRIKALTELFGPSGIGWYVEVLEKRERDCPSGEVMCFVDIALYVKDGEGFSKPIYGTGGHKLVAKESSGLYANDEGWKMAYTDAISVACKALGLAADVYWAEDKTKYTAAAEPEKAEPVKTITSAQMNELTKLFDEARLSAMLNYYKINALYEMAYDDAEKVIAKAKKKKEA